MSELDKAAIGARIKQARKEAGLTQEELADVVGVRARAVQYWESGETVPYRWFRQLEEGLGRSLGWFLRGEEATPLDQERLEALLDRFEKLVGRLEETATSRVHARAG